MTIYSRKGWRFARQVLFDVISIAIIFGAYVTGTFLHDRIEGYRVIGESVASSASDVADSFESAGDSLGAIGIDVGFIQWTMPEAVSSPFFEAAGALGDIEQAGTNGAEAVSDTANAVWFSAFVVPTLLAITLWLLVRGRWIWNARALTTLAGTSVGREVLAMRFAVNARASELARAQVSPMTAVRNGDTAALDALAGLELERQGIKPPRRSAPE